MKKVARLRVAQDEQFVPPGVKISSNPEQTVRTTGRIKKPKAVFDPSDNYMPRSQRMSTQISLQATTSPGKLVASVQTSPSTTGTRRERSLSTGSNTSNTSISLNNDICIVCSKREPRRGGNYRNKLISCVDCSKRVHKLCMSVDFYESAPVRQNFKCDNCRTCEVCSSNANIGSITCSKCCKTYHLGCHVPKVPKIYQTERHWKCSKCHPINASSAVVNNNNNSINNDSVIPVKIIRQIIGDNANLPNTTPKTQQPVAAKEQIQQLQEPTKPQSLSSEQHPKLQPKVEQTDEQLQIPDAVEESSTRTADLRRSRTDSMTTSTSDDSGDEDYEYVEKKKLRINSQHINNENNINASDTNSDKPVNKQTILDTSKKAINDLPLPKREDVKTWSVEQVAAYISEYFPNEAFVFKDQEIDGNALLLLKRSDVVQKLPLKLGPSLRIYNLILKVQTQTLNDPTLGWDCSVDSLLPSTE